jgi:Lamin Tail Domain/Protein of unknown function (DUF1524)
MSRVRVNRLSVGLAVALTIGATMLTPVTATAADVQPDARPATAIAHRSARVVHAHLRAAIAKLRVAREHRTGYVRDKFKLWIDADHDCQDTRDEVLAAESRTHVTGCDIEHGRWFSYYDHKTWTRASDVDIDHVVPLAETWDSGAWRWTAQTRERYANDLADPRTLLAVTDNVNEAKGDSDIAEWQPQYDDCRYLDDWTAIKTRWRLAVDADEKSFMTTHARHCPNRLITVRRAAIDRHPPGGGGHQHGHKHVKIERIRYNPPGDESTHPNGEYVAIENHGHATINLAGWTLSDATSETFYFPNFQLHAGKTVRVRSGKGRATLTTLHANWGARWNNDGDTATLYDGNGTSADSCSYTGTDTESVRC